MKAEAIVTVKIEGIPEIKRLIEAANAVLHVKLRHPGQFTEPELTARIMDLGDVLADLRGGTKIDHAFRSLNGDDKCAAIVGQLPEKIGCGGPASEHQA